MSLVQFRPEAYADLAHLVERNLAKVEVAGPSPVIRLETETEKSRLFFVREIRENSCEKFTGSLDKHAGLCYTVMAIGVWLSPVECLVRDQEAAGSNPVTPTIRETSFVYHGRRRFFAL